MHEYVCVSVCVCERERDFTCAYTETWQRETGHTFVHVHSDIELGSYPEALQLLFNGNIMLQLFTFEYKGHPLHAYILAQFTAYFRPHLMLGVYTYIHTHNSSEAD